MFKKLKIVFFAIIILLIFFFSYKLIFKTNINPNTLFPGKWSFEEDLKEDPKLIVYNFNDKGKIIQFDYGLNNPLPVISTVGIYEIMEDSIFIKFDNRASKSKYYIVKNKSSFKLKGKSDSDYFILTRIKNLEKYYN